MAFHVNTTVSQLPQRLQFQYRINAKSMKFECKNRCNYNVWNQCTFNVKSMWNVMEVRYKKLEIRKLEKKK